MYQKIKSIITNHHFKVLILVQLFIKLLAVFLGIFTNRWLNTYLPEGDYADYNFITSLNAVVLGIFGFGIPTLLQKEYTNLGKDLDFVAFKDISSTNIKDGRYIKHRKAVDYLKKIWVNYNFIRLLTFFAGILASLVIGYFQGLNLYYLVLIFSAQFILLWDLNYRGITDATGRSWMFSLTDLISKLVVVVLLYFLIFTNLFADKSLLSVFGWILCIAYLSGFMADTFFQRKYVSHNWRLIELKNTFSHIFKIWPMILSGVFLSMYANTDRVILPYFISDNLYNGYTNVYRLFEIATIVPTLVGPILSSRIKKEMDHEISENQKQAQKDTTSHPKSDHSNIIINFIQKTSLIKNLNSLGTLNIVQKYSLLIIFVGISTSLFFAILAPHALFLIDSENRYMTDTLPSIISLSPSLIFILFSNTVGNLTIFFGKEKYEFYTHVVNFFAAMVSYFVFIPLFGVIGAAVATTIFYTVDLCTKIYFFDKMIKKITSSNN